MVLPSARSAVTTRLIRIGYWAGDDNASLPDPGRFVDADWSYEEREAVTEYLSRGFVARAYLGQSNCRICGVTVGSRELSDGVYLWPEGLAHYVEAHAVRLPDSVLEHIEQRTAELEDAQVDDAWWRSLVE